MIDQQVVSSAAVFDSADSPQTKAAEWLAEVDPANLAVPTNPITSTIGYNYMFRYVMAVNYYALGGEDWFDDMNFLSGFDICDWHSIETDQQKDRIGVYCDNDDVPRDLYFGTLRPAFGLGMLASVCDIGNVRSRMIWSHSPFFSSTTSRCGSVVADILGMVGEIPKENGMLTTLFTFEIHSNEDVTGTIPTELCNLSTAATMILAHTSLSGRIPSCFGNMNVANLILNHNLLTGPIPTELGQLENLSTLEVQDNMLTGGLPSTLANPMLLHQLFIDDNPSLGGNPLPTINSMPSLYWLMGSNCDFEGDIDETFLADALDIYSVDLSHNRFTSSNGIPEHLFSSLLQFLDLSNNELSGGLPSDIPDYSELIFLSLHENQLSGLLPEALTNLTYLDHLDLSSNNFDGPIPDFLGDMTALMTLFLPENNFNQGPIPASFANLSNLRELSLRSTSRTGPLPDYIGLGDFNWTELIDFGSNALTGPIPESYGDLQYLDYLLLNQNAGITGTIPDSFAGLEYLVGLYVDGTGLSGDLDVVCNLPNFEVIDSDEEVIFADCGGAVPTISCRDDCCTCCVGGAGGCSQPSLGNLDASWENDFLRPYDDDRFDFQNENESSP